MRALMTEPWQCPISTETGYTVTVGRGGEFTRQTLNCGGMGSCRIDCSGCFTGTKSSAFRWETLAAIADANGSGTCSHLIYSDTLGGYSGATPILRRRKLGLRELV